MGLKRVAVVCALVMASVSYWLYAPLPPGYCFASRRQYQMMMISMKAVNFVSRVGSFLGFGSRVEIIRGFASKVSRFKEPLHIDGIETSDTDFDGVHVRIYEPSRTLNETLPAIVFYHGGGFTYGSIDSVDSLTKRLCKETHSVVVSVEYRLAPEFPFPAAIDDCAVATKYFLKHAADFHVDPHRVAVAGDSAGGNLAATVSIKLRDDKFPVPIKLQVLIYPVTQGLDLALPSMIQNRNGPLLTHDMMPFFTAMYIDGKEDNIPVYSENRHVIKSFRKKIEKTFLNIDKLPKEFVEGYVRPQYPEGDEKVWNEVKGKFLNPYYSPLVAENLENLPEAFIFTANYDPLRDEGWLYGIRLKEAKNKVTMYNGENSFHGIMSFIGVYPEAEGIFSEIVKFIRATL